MSRTPLFRSFLLALQAARQQNLTDQGLPPAVPHVASQWTRRKFLRTTALAGVAGVSGGSLGFPEPSYAAGPTKPSIAIIGGGDCRLECSLPTQKSRGFCDSL